MAVKDGVISAGAGEGEPLGGEGAVGKQRRGPGSEEWEARGDARLGLCWWGEAWPGLCVPWGTTERLRTSQSLIQGTAPGKVLETPTLSSPHSESPPKDPSHSKSSVCACSIWAPFSKRGSEGEEDPAPRVHLPSTEPTFPQRPALQARAPLSSGNAPTPQALMVPMASLLPSSPTQHIHKLARTFQRHNIVCRHPL